MSLAATGAAAEPGVDARDGISKIRSPKVSQAKPAAPAITTRTAATANPLEDLPRLRWTGGVPTSIWSANDLLASMVRLLLPVS